MHLTFDSIDLQKKNYSTGLEKNANLYTSGFGIERTKHFGDFDLEETYNTLSKSPVLPAMAREDD